MSKPPQQRSERSAGTADFTDTDVQLRDRVLAIIQSSLPRKPLAKDVAAMFVLDQTEFSNQLKREGTSFRELITQARRDLCSTLLMDKRLTLAQAARALGFWDPNTFYRAFRAWEGVTPRQWTERQTAGLKSRVQGESEFKEPRSQEYRRAVDERYKRRFQMLRRLAQIAAWATYTEANASEDSTQKKR